MSPEAQQVAIAKAVGYTLHPNPTGGPTIAWFDPNGQIVSHWTSYAKELLHLLPDYLNDLNAMHEAEKVLRNPGLSQWCDYAKRLNRICGIALYAEIHATAAQRAEAFLRTLDLWVD